ncbi:MAG: ABC transporter substrate-binding protein [Candidatus Bathyarchaeia archaeon]
MDFSSYIMKWKEENVEVIYSAAPSPYVQELVRQLVRYGFWPKMIFAQMTFFLEDLAGIGNTLGDGICSPFFWTKEYPDPSRELAETYMRAFNKYYVPDLGVSYSGLQVIKDALERAGSLDRDAINKAFSETDLMTVEGRVKFDQKTHVSKWPTVVIQWRAYGSYGWTIEVVYSPYPYIKTTAPFLFPLPPPRK